MTTMKKIIRTWPLGPNGFSYERIGRDRIVINYCGAVAGASRQVAADFIRAVRKGCRIGHAQREQEVFGK